LITATLAAARMSRLIAEDVLTLPLRRATLNRFGTSAWISKLILCAPWCLSMWFSILLPVVYYWHPIWFLAVLSIPAGSMACALILRAADRE
jgi:hypothetical protein